jgi:RNA polymerase sigma factor (sigma-70 family)
LREPDRLHKAFLEARDLKHEVWPEPETSELYRGIFRASRNIIGATDSRLIDNYYGYAQAASRIACNTLLKVDQFRGRSKFSTWLFRVVRNELVSLIREIKDRRETQIEAIPEIQVTDGPKFLHLPSNLSEQEAQIVRLHVEVGYSIRELALLLGMHKTQVHRIWKRAQNKLKSQLRSSSK